jgi:F-type H+-transporting ATPase subunit delta
LRTSQLAKRYAKALFALSDETNVIDATLADIQSLSDLFEKETRLRAFLFTPEVEKNAKRAVLAELVQNKVSTLVYNFLLLLIKKGRQTYFSEIVFELYRLYDRKRNRLQARVTSVVSLDEESLSEIRKQLSESLKADIQLENIVDSEILGGLVVQVESKVYDASLRHRIAEMRTQMKSAKNYSK